jgi:hypothetical protein
MISDDRIFSSTTKHQYVDVGSRNNGTEFISINLRDGLALAATELVFRFVYRSTTEKTPNLKVMSGREVGEFSTLSGTKFTGVRLNKFTVLVRFKRSTKAELYGFMLGKGGDAIRDWLEGVLKEEGFDMATDVKDVCAFFFDSSGEGDKPFEIEMPVLKKEKVKK